MKVAITATLVALAFGAATASADAPIPAGFTPNSVMSQAASFVAGKAVTDYCAATDSAFEDSLTDLPGWADDVYVDGYSTIGETSSFFRPIVCSYLVRWRARKPVNGDHLAAALLAMTHEAELLAGVADESIADCKALAVMPQVIRRFFPLRKPLTLHTVMRDAWDAHDSQVEQYLENCPSR